MFRQPLQLAGGSENRTVRHLLCELALLWQRPLSLVNVLVVVVGWRFRWSRAFCVAASHSPM